MRKRIAPFLAAAWSGVASTLIASGSARAQQIDVNPPLPNVLLMVDNSGSMERMIDGTLPEDQTENACDISNCIVTAGSPPTTTCSVATRMAPLTTYPPANRWNNVVQALTGSPKAGYHCIAMPRAGGAASTFNNEYQINGAPPYDVDYYLPYHRAVAIDPVGNKPCVFAPGSLPGASVGGVGNPPSHAGGNANSFPAGSIINRPYGQLTVTSNSCAFAQNPDGLLSNFQDLIRFGLMTFDQDPSAGLGVGAPPFQVLTVPAAAAFTGMWSYFPGWDGSSASNPANGEPTGCMTPLPFEVGARNPAAPPWEGRMMYFPTDETTATRDSQNTQIQSILNATRPYGGTPLAGMFADAKYYFTADPNGPSNSVVDAYASGGCRKQFIILLTDGAPNEDMRPTYVGGGAYAGGCGVQDNPSAPCPYNHPEFTADQLANHPAAGQSPVYTYVVGFAVSSPQNDQGMTVNCETIDPSIACTNLNANSALIPCCELQKIAVAGAPPQPPGQLAHAYFANNPGDLQAALGAIFSQIASTQTTRSVPAYSSVSGVANGGTGNNPNQETFYGAFSPLPSIPPPGNNLATVGEPWSGDITRTRFICGGSPTLQSGAPGDDFAADLNSNSPARYFVAVQAMTGGVATDSSATLRPFFATSPGADGLGNAKTTTYAGTASTVVNNILPAALNLPAGPHSCQYTSNQNFSQQYLTDTQCANMLMDFTFGQSFAGPSDFTFVSRVGNAFGGVFHAIPTVVGPPSASLHDDSYNLFSTSTNVVACPSTGTAQNTGSSCRQNLLYAATTDGILHAFWTDVPKTTASNNEMWAMVPPGVLPNLRASYPAEDKFLLDGSPITKDVVFDRPQGSAFAPDGTTNPWHTMLVAGFGPTMLGYYAIDISKPSVPVVTTPPTTGPVFEWQLTKMPATNYQLFGQHGATPTITTVFIGSPTPHEVGVAILPGGLDHPAVTPTIAGGCKRAATAATDLSEPGYPFRTNVQCWGAGAAADPVVGRSVTVVRLDTGEVIATFMRKADAPVGDTLRLAGRIVDSPFDSPMTGTAVVYPTDVGAVASKAFIADQDGTIWKLDLSSTNPFDAVHPWTAELFFDMYNTTVDTASSAWSDGQPVQVPMQIALDRTGALVLAAASGPQDQFTPSGLYLVYSLSEKIQAVLGTSTIRSWVNWYLSSFTNPQITAKAGLMTNASQWTGERVSGPMAIFDGTLYFATYATPPANATSCVGGKAYLWGLDFITPFDATNLSLGGKVILPPVPASAIHYTDLTPTGANLVPSGAVVPGVSVQATTACVTLGASGADQYVPGATHSAVTPGSFTAGGFSLVGQFGAAGATGAGTFSQALPTPREPTMINSWASVVE